MKASESIHVRSFREFIERRLPEALGKVIPLTGYKAEWTGESRGSISFSVGDDGPRLTFADLLFPRPDGSFLPRIGENPLCIVMTASSNNLEEATIKAMGEQLMEEIEPRLVPPPSDGEWDEAMLRAWFPLDQWLEEIWGGGIPTAQWMDITNPIAEQTHLRRIVLLGGAYRVVDLPNPFGFGYAGGDASFHRSQVGRVDPMETPEGPNTGRVLTLARGADVRDGKIVPAPDRAEDMLGVSNSLVPLLCHDEPTRQLMGANMIRQALVQDDPEPPLVRSGLEQEDGASFLGRNLLTAYLHWKGMNYEDAIVLSESAAKRLAPPPWVAEVGDKLSTRHGTKGVVGAVLPEEEMPHLPDGRPVELLFDPMGLYSRLNFGQVIEATLGLVAEKKGEPIVASPFRQTTPEELRALLREAELPESGQFALRDGKQGAELDAPTTVGQVYWYRLVHEARSKIHAFAPKWQQSGGYRGGARIGRMEIAALRAVGAYENILEALSTRARGAKPAIAWANPDKSRAPEDTDWFLQRVGGGFIDEQAEPPSPAFMRVQRALAVAGIQMQFAGGKVRLRWADGEGVALAEPVEHPWRPGARLTHIGPPDKHTEAYLQAMAAGAPLAGDLTTPVGKAYERAVAANERLADALESDEPEAARTALHKAVAELLDTLREDCRVRFGENSQFTGRSVLAPGYDLQIDQVGLPEDIAYPLFAPLIADRVGWAWVHDRHDRSKRHIEELMCESVVVVNRAPTQELTAITAFSPVMVPGRAILLHPLCCPMFNADYDGDQAAVWLPITKAGQAEAKQKLTVLAHLERDPTVMVGHLTPAGAVLMGLAYALESPDGGDEFAALWPAGCDAPPAPLTREALLVHLLAALDETGPEALLELLEGLYRMGITWATRSGASFSPFVGEGLDLPAPPASDAGLSWHAYASIVEGAIMAQGESIPTLRDPVRAVRCGARGSAAHVRAVIGPLAVPDPYDPHAPVKQGYRDGVTAEELWPLVARSRRRLQEMWEGQAELASGGLLPEPGGDSFLARAMRSPNPGEVFAEAAEKRESDPLTDPDVRLWIGLLPLPEGE